jgi:Rubredoxin
MSKWRCGSCDYVYDEAHGDPDEGIPPGTEWDALPDDWVCPECGADKEDFTPAEHGASHHW